MTIKTETAVSSSTAKPLFKGTVIFYNKDKGFGFVRCDDGKEYHFGHRAIAGTTFPEPGDLVEFSLSARLPKPGKSPSIEHLEIRRKDAKYDDGKVVCPHCGRRVSPRVVMRFREPDASYCPLCGGLVKRFIIYEPDTSDPYAGLKWICLICFVLFMIGYIQVVIDTGDPFFMF